MVFSFKVGDRVRHEDGDEGTVVEVGHRLNGEKWMNYYVDWDGYENYHRASELTKISSCDTAKEEDSMSNCNQTNGFAAKIRHAFRSADDKVLLEAGIIDEAGQTTETGRRVLSDLLFEQNKAEVVSRAKKVLDEDKKKK